MVTTSWRPFVIAGIALGLGLGAQSAQAATYYVSTSGNDGNTCATAKSPGASAKRSIAGAAGGASCLVSGDTLIVQAGTYLESVSNVIPPGGGTEATRTVFKCETYLACTIRQVLLSTDDDWITIENFKIDANFESVHGITLISSPACCDGSLHPSHVRVQNNEVLQTTGELIYDGNGQFNEFLYNKLHHGGYVQGGSAGGIYGLSRNGTFRGNEIHHAGVGLSLHTSGLVPSNNLVEGEWYHDCVAYDGTHPMPSMILAGTSGNTIRRNVFGPNCTFGVNASLDGAVNNKFDNLTIYGNASGGFRVAGPTNSGNVIRNSIVVGNGGTQISICIGCGSESSNIITGTPTTLWTDPANGNFTLKPGSPAIDACSNIGLPFNGSAPDCGALESGTAAIPASTDLNNDGATNVGDVQLSINKALGLQACGSGDINRDGACTITDLQLVVNKAMGL